jgi:toxin ParE1/3/4
LKVRWTELARDDVARIVRHIANDNVTAALRTGDRIVSATEGLSQFPERGRLGEEAGTRELVISGTPYLTIYRIAAEVEILRVIHGAQQWPPEQ